MRALLLAAGTGSRLAPLTEVLPKCLVPINGVPLLAYWLEALSACGIGDILLNTHYRADQVVRFVRQSRWADRVEIIHEDRLLGTGGTLIATRRKWQDDDLLMVHADNLCHCDFASFLSAHRRRPADIEATLMTFDTQTPSSCGIVTLSPDNRLTGFHEKHPDPPGHRASAAVFVLSPAFASCLDDFSHRSEIDFSRDILPKHLHVFQAWHNDEFMSDIGHPASYLQAQLEYRWAPPDGVQPADASAEVIAGLSATATADWSVRAVVSPGFTSAGEYEKCGERILAASVKETP